ncbi:MAG: hypothetical protein QG629_929 [Patescibacteria group bacterium]|nr:hypothetical protein [Candidatus Saccharibacteria bacterium]MDQ5963846.1 hypothetical protein [Patescibacteria group bacterium]
MTQSEPTSIDLSRVVRIQAAFDSENDNFEGANTPDGKRHHTALHLGKLLGKVMTVEERAAHGDLDTTVIKKEVIGDLIVFAAQLSRIEGVDLTEAYRERLGGVAMRNGTDGSATRALSVE